jgi:hypothetical protein
MLKTLAWSHHFTKRGSRRFWPIKLVTFYLHASGLLTDPLCAGVPHIRALSPAWTGSPAHTFSSCTISPQQNFFLLSSVAIFVYNRSAISVNRRDVSYQFLSSFSRLYPACIQPREWAVTYMCVRVYILPLFLSFFRLDFGTVPTSWNI